MSLLLKINLNAFEWNILLAEVDVPEDVTNVGRAEGGGTTPAIKDTFLSLLKLSKKIKFKNNNK